MVEFLKTVQRKRKQKNGKSIIFLSKINLRDSLLTLLFRERWRRQETHDSEEESETTLAKREIDRDLPNKEKRNRKKQNFPVKITTLERKKTKILIRVSWILGNSFQPFRDSCDLLSLSLSSINFKRKQFLRFSFSCLNKKKKQKV